MCLHCLSHICCLLSDISGSCAAALRQVLGSYPMATRQSELQLPGRQRCLPAGSPVPRTAAAAAVPQWPPCSWRPFRRSRCPLPGSLEARGRWAHLSSSKLCNRKHCYYASFRICVLLNAIPAKARCVCRQATILGHPFLILPVLSKTDGDDAQC